MTECDGVGFFGRRLPQNDTFYSVILNEGEGSVCYILFGILRCAQNDGVTEILRCAQNDGGRELSVCNAWEEYFVLRFTELLVG